MTSKNGWVSAWHAEVTGGPPSSVGQYSHRSSLGSYRHGHSGVCDPTPEGFQYILVIADYFSKWTEAFPMKNKCADTVADLLVDNIILRFGMPLVIHSDQGREFENGLMKSLCTLMGCTKTRTAPYHPESDGMIERFNRTCLMMLSMFVNDRRDNWNELLPFVMHAYRTSIHESTGYSPFRLMMGEECSLPQDVSTAELRTKRENDIAPHPFATWVRDALEVAYDHGIPFRKQQPAGNDYMTPRQLIGSFRLGRGYYVITHRPLNLNWVPHGLGPHQVVRQATGHTVGIQRNVDKPIIFVHVDDLKLCPGPQDVSWTSNTPTAKSLCASMVAFRPGSHISDMTPEPSVDVSAWGDESDLQTGSEEFGQTHRFNRTWIITFLPSWYNLPRLQVSLNRTSNVLQIRNS